MISGVERGYYIPGDYLSNPNKNTDSRTLIARAAKAQAV